MPIGDAAERAIFTDTDEFGASVSWTVAPAAAVSVPAIYDRDYLLLQAGGDDAGQEGSEPQIMVADSNIPAGAARGDVIVVDGATYAAGEFKPDGTGFTVIMLQGS